jgi:hypothetical protein
METSMFRQTVTVTAIVVAGGSLAQAQEHRVKSDSEGWWCDPYWGCYVVGNAQYSNQWELAGGITLRL